MQKRTPNLVEQLRRAIRDSGWSLNRLGQESGIDSSRLSRFMRGERDLTLDAVARLCLVLGLTLVRGGSARAPPLPRSGRSAADPSGSPRPLR